MIIIITTGLSIGLLGWVIIAFFGVTALHSLLSPIVGIYYWIVEPPEEFQNKYIQPSLEEIVKTPYNELPTRESKFIVTVDGVEALCTYNIDDTWFTGSSNGRTGHALRMGRGIILSQFTKEEIGKKINVTFEPHNPKNDEEDFRSFEKSYAAVPNDTWYNLVPFDEFAEQTIKKEAEQWELKEK